MIDTHQQSQVRSRTQGFTLIDVLVSLGVISVLIGLLLPSLQAAREAARRVVCASNVRQQTIGLAMFAEEHQGQVAPSQFLPLSTDGPITKSAMHRMMTVKYFRSWDGLGYLYANEYLDNHGVYYCPSHTGTHTKARYDSLWADKDAFTLITANYHYRGMDADGSRVLWSMKNESALVADGMASRKAFNHTVGTNVARADLSVDWFDDHSKLFYDLLPATETDPDAPAIVAGAWDALDKPANTNADSQEDTPIKGSRATR